MTPLKLEEPLKQGAIGLADGVRLENHVAERRREVVGDAILQSSGPDPRVVAAPVTEVPSASVNSGPWRTAPHQLRRVMAAMSPMIAIASVLVLRFGGETNGTVHTLIGAARPSQAHAAGELASPRVLQRQGGDPDHRRPG